MSNDQTSLVQRLTPAELRGRIDVPGSVGAGMIPKLAACAEAVEGGVGSAHIIDGRVHHALLIELLTDQGVGHDDRAGEALREASARHPRPDRGRPRADPGAVAAIRRERPLAGQGIALYFEKPSARTRNSMEMAAVQLGAHPVYLQRDELGIGTRESVADVARTLACYHAVIAARVWIMRCSRRWPRRPTCRCSTCCPTATIRCRRWPTC